MTEQNPTVIIEVDANHENEVAVHMEEVSIAAMQGSTDTTQTSSHTAEENGIDFSGTIFISPGLQRGKQPRLNEWERKQICIFKRDNPKVTHKKIAEHFTHQFGRPIGTKAVYYTLQEYDKWIALDHPSSRVKVSRQIRSPELEQRLFEWMKDYVSQKSFDTLANIMIKRKAIEIATDLGVVHQFGFSQSWLNRMKKRFSYWIHKETGVSITEGEKILSPDNFHHNEDEIQDYNVEDVFMIGDIELFYALPVNYSKPSSIRGGIGPTDKITVGVCTNATGAEKPRPIVVGARHVPPSFEGDFDPSQHADYYSSINSKLTVHIFRKWLRDFDKSLDEAGRKIVLLVSEAPCYKTGGQYFKNVRVHTRSSGSPLNGLLQSFKASYRKEQIKLLTNKLDEGIIAPTVDMKQALMLVGSAWSIVKGTTIVAHWKNAGFLPVLPQEISANYIIDSEKKTDLLELGNLIQIHDSKLRALKVLSAEKDIQESEFVTSNFRDSLAVSSSSTDDLASLNIDASSDVSASDARAMLHKVIHFLERRGVGEEEFATLQALANKL